MFWAIYFIPKPLTYFWLVDVQAISVSAKDTKTDFKRFGYIYKNTTWKAQNLTHISFKKTA